MDGEQMNLQAFYQQAVRQVPLAEATLLGFSFLTDLDFMTEVYDRCRGRSFEHELSFSCMANLIADALLTHGGSLLPAIQAAKANKEIEGSPQAVYGKLRRCPQSLSEGFLSAGATRLAGIMAPVASPVPNSLQGFDVFVIDGKTIKKVAKRLKPTRSFQGSVLGGKVLVAMDLATGIVKFMSSNEDGHTNDVPLVPLLLDQMRAAPSDRIRLGVLDSQFCDLGVPQLFLDEDYHYVIRWSNKTVFTPSKQREAKSGCNKEGQKYVEEWGEMGATSDKRRLFVRRITVFRPNEEEVKIFTDLLDEETYPAADLLELYRERWSLENVFQQITEVYHLQHLISSTPLGTIFQCAYCLIVYNILVVHRSYIMSNLSPERVQPEASNASVAKTASSPAPKQQPVAKQPPSRKAASQTLPATTTVPLKLFSMEKYFKDATEELIAWNKMIPMHWTLDYFATPLTPSKMKRRLHELLGGKWDSKWLKSIKKKYAPKEKDPPKPGGHTSVYRLIHGDPRTKDV